MIWFNLFIPLIAIIFISIFFKRKIHAIEYGLIFGVPLLLIVITYLLSINLSTRDTEYLHSFIVKAEYYEYWSTWDDETCTRTVSCGEDCIETETYDCSHCDEESARWIAYDNTGRQYSISQEYFNKLCVLWNNKKFVELNRHIVHHFGCGKDGDMYVTEFDGDFNKIQPVTNSGSYTNKIQASKSVFNFQEVSKEDKKNFKIYDYPNVNRFNYDPILGYNDTTSEKKLMRWNALLGRGKQVSMFICIWDNQDIETSYMQERYWIGGNKNEVILCVGKNDSNIIWTRVISWTDKEEMKHNIENSVLDMKFNLSSIVDTLAINVRKDYKRKEFKDFAYIKVDPSSNWLIVAFILTLISTIVISVISIKNDTDFN